MTTSSRASCWSLALAAVLVLGGCGKKEEEPDRVDATTPPAAPGVRSPASPMTVSHVLLAYAGAERSKANRSKETALSLAKELTADVKAGRRTWQDAVDRFTDDRNPDTNVANSGNFVDQRDRAVLAPGTYVINDFTSFAPPFMDAVKKLSVGEVTPEPVETSFGYHVIKRVK